MPSPSPTTPATSWATGSSTTTETNVARSGLLASAGRPTGDRVDGIKCEVNEQVLFHVHAHLAVYVDGVLRKTPAGIGIAPPRRVEQTRGGPFVVSGRC